MFGSDDDYSAPCNQPLRPGHSLVSGNDRRHGSKVTYNCNNGYSLVGSKTRTCNDGRWSGNVPECKGDIYYLFRY